MKILVVDDQPDVVQGILSGVGWERLNVEKAFGASSAAEARTVLKNEKIDILLCDIEMPGENGLSLATWALKYDSGIKCIFLTAHADFSYARTALKLEAVDYLLQPASYQSIEEAILKASQRRLEEQTAQAAEQEFLNFRRTVLRDFLQGIQNEAEKAAEKARAFRFPCTAGSLCRCVWIQIQNRSALFREGGLLLYAVQNVLSELLEPWTRQPTVISMGKDTYLTVMLSGGSPPSEEYAGVRKALEEFCRFEAQEFHLDVTCYLDEAPRAFRELPEEYLRLQEAQHNNVAKKAGVLPITHIPVLSSAQPEFSKWKSLLDEGCASVVREEIHRYLNELTEQGALDRNALSHFHEGFLELFFTKARQCQEGSQEIFSDTFDYTAALEASTSLPRLLEFVDFATEYMEEKQGEGQERGRAQIDRVLQFIQKNLTRNIGRQEIAKAVYLNPEYLSRLFKREMGISLSEYLVQERMKIAKSLLRDTSFSISIVASKVGYINFSHFAKAFKKEFGMSPSEYRKACGRKG